MGRRGCCEDAAIDFSGTSFSLYCFAFRNSKEHRLKPVLLKAGDIMTTTVTAPSMQSIGLYVQIAGAGAFVAGVVLSLHHYGTGICFIAGAAAFFIGKKIKAS
jgi:hypothetical protein